MTDPVKDRGQWVKDFGKRGRVSGSILDYVRLTEPTNEKLPLPCSPGYGYDPVNHRTWKMACKRRNCPDCGWYWACKWRNALKEKQRCDYDFKVPAPTKALTLTFAENISFDIMQKILRQFWKAIRRAYPNTEYWGVVEYNQAHTIPHLHFVVQQNNYLELDFIDYCWKLAQKRYKLDHLAWNIRIEKIRKNTQAYFTKYITKLTGGKDEIPRRENWRGRFVRYSTHFFPAPIALMLQGRLLQDKLKAMDKLDTVYWYVRAPLKNLKDFQLDCRNEEKAINQIIVKVWDPIGDKARGTPIPPDDLFTDIETIPVYYEKDRDKWSYLGQEGFNRLRKEQYYGPAF